MISFRFDNGDIISRGGSAADGFYVLQSGRLESVVDATPRTTTGVACGSCVAVFFQRNMLDRELERTELITFLFRNVCRKLAEQNCEVSEHSYIDLQSNNCPRQDYQSNLSLEPISTRMERYLGTTAAPRANSATKSARQRPQMNKPIVPARTARILLWSAVIRGWPPQDGVGWSNPAG